MTARLVHTPLWPSLMARDFIAARGDITLTALSLLPPRTPNGSPFSAWWIALLAAQSRGVSVRIILPAPTPIHPATFRNARVAREIHPSGMRVELIAGARLLHAKTARIDGKIAWVGSGNFTAAAAHHNYEAFLRVEDADIAAQLAGFAASLG
jgi:phosphatidylserine/phosphatidylglycerophosphate/cardiolipin synthase-like enzyme